MSSEFGLSRGASLHKALTCKILDVSENKLSKEQVLKFTDSLEGRSLTKEVPPMWLATDFEELFTKNFACCNPYGFGGCICKVKRVIHIGPDLNVLMHPNCNSKEINHRRFHRRFHLRFRHHQIMRHLPPPPNKYVYGSGFVSQNK